MSNWYALSLDPNGSKGAMAVTRDFQAPNLATAQTVAQSISTILGVTCYLVNGPDTSLQPPYTKYTPGSQGGTVSAPSGVSTT